MYGQQFASYTQQSVIHSGKDSTPLQLYVGEAFCQSLLCIIAVRSQAGMSPLTFFYFSFNCFPQTDASSFLSHLKLSSLSTYCFSLLFLFFSATAHSFPSSGAVRCFNVNPFANQWTKSRL